MLCFSIFDLTLGYDSRAFSKSIILLNSLVTQSVCCFPGCDAQQNGNQFFNTSPK